MLDLIAELEARLDFDEDLPDMDTQRLRSQVRRPHPLVPAFLQACVIFGAQHII